MLKKYLILLTLVLLVTIQSCNNSSNSNANKDIVDKNAQGYFKGILNFKISNALVNKKVHYKTLSVILNGDSIKQEVKEYYLTQLVKIYGMVLNPNSDSVLYYTKVNDKNYFTTITKKDYFNWVATLNPPIDSLSNKTLEDDKPFSYVFKNLPEKNKYILTEGENATYLGFKNCKKASIAFGEANICSIIYSKDIKVSPNVLLATEHKQPYFLKTIALEVRYTQLKKAADADGSKWKQLLKKAVETSSQMAQYNYVLQSQSPLEANSFDLPANCIYQSYLSLDEIINPPLPEGSSSGSQHHHHHFD